MPLQHLSYSDTQNADAPSMLCARWLTAEGAQPRAEYKAISREPSDQSQVEWWTSKQWFYLNHWITFNAQWLLCNQHKRPVIKITTLASISTHGNVLFIIVKAKIMSPAALNARALLNRMDYDWLEGKKPSWKWLQLSLLL